MHSTAKAMLVLLFVATVGVLGCSQRPGSGRAEARIRDLQSRNAKWEEDYRVVISVNDRLRKQLAQSQSRYAEMQEKLQQVQLVKAERDALRLELRTRITERDTAEKQLLRFQKDLSGLVDRLQTATRNMGGAARTAASTLPVQMTLTTNTESD